MRKLQFLTTWASFPLSSSPVRISFGEGFLGLCQIAFIIEKVHIIWEPLLLPSVYEKSMALILEAVFSRLAKEILLIDDMAAEETLQVHRKN